MTDVEIIKGIEMCLSNTINFENCGECPDNCVNEMLKNAVELINRQRTEIEGLKKGLQT